MDATAALASLGFSEYEARAYVALLRRSPLNGYEVAKLSEVPRGNVYAVLQKLEERGTIARVDSPEGIRYTPVHPDEMLKRMEGRFQRALGTAARLLDEVGAPTESIQVANLHGYATVLEHAAGLIAAARDSLLLAVWPEEAKALAEDVAAASARGVNIRTLCLAGCQQECGACRGKIHRYRMASAPEPRWLVLVPDRAEVLAGEIGVSNGGQDGETIRAVRTQQRLMVELIASYVRRSILLASILADVGPRLRSLLSGDAREVWNLIEEEQGLGDWLAQDSQFDSETHEENRS